MLPVASVQAQRFDVLIVGGGPAGLSAAIRLKQLCKSKDTDLRVGLIEKSDKPGGHTLSGCVLDPRAIDELLPEWRTEFGPNRTTRITRETCHFVLPPPLPRVRLPMPPPMKARLSRKAGKGDCFLSLGDLCSWLTEKAEGLGVEVYNGFGADRLIWKGSDKASEIVAGIKLNKGGEELLAPFTLLAEGCRGHLSEQVISRYQLRAGKAQQTYALGMKEIWRVPLDRHKPGLMAYTMGWPADSTVNAGGFEYHQQQDGLVHIGWVTGLDYSNPHFDPFAEFQRWKSEPNMAKLLGSGAECLQYGARTLAEGGPQAIPSLVFPGGALAGCAAGFLNAARLKGAHTAMKTGMLAAESAFGAAIRHDGSYDDYQTKVKSSWVWKELWGTRNMRPSFRELQIAGRGLIPFLGFSAADAFLLRGKVPFTFNNKLEDHERTLPAALTSKITYPKPNKKVTFDRAASLARSGVFHPENAPSHLVLKEPGVAVPVNLGKFGAIDERYCPAGVYEYELPDPSDVKETLKQAKLTIHAGNCLHCKTCDIKDPTQNTKWTMPSLGGGPAYNGM